jgi:hydrogenase nickel incorporation protein HypA/HybF
MHELGIAESALQLALAEARKADATRVVRLVLRVGALSGVDPEALRFALESLAPGTPAAGAAVEIEPVATIAYCAHCQKEFTADHELYFECPACGQPSANIKHGRELELTRVELAFSHVESELPS